MSIKAFKLTLGYDIIAEVESETPEGIVIRRPLGIAVREVQDRSGQPSMAVSLQEVLDFAENQNGEVILYTNVLAFKYDPAVSLATEYKKITTGLILPASAL